MTLRRRSRSFYHKVLEDRNEEYHGIIERYRLEVDNTLRVAISDKMGTMDKKTSAKFTVSVAKPDLEKPARKKKSMIKYFSRTYYKKTIANMENLIVVAESAFTIKLFDLYQLLLHNDFSLKALQDLREDEWHYFDTSEYLDELD